MSVLSNLIFNNNLPGTLVSGESVFDGRCPSTSHDLNSLTGLALIDNRISAHSCIDKPKKIKAILRRPLSDEGVNHPEKP